MKRFPYQRYQALGITRVPRKVTSGDIAVEPRENWTSAIISTINTYRAAQSLAREKGWAFNWRLVEAPDAGHDARRMYGGPQATAAFASD